MVRILMAIQPFIKLFLNVIPFYEDNLDGKISDERFKSMYKSYDKEQAELTSKIESLESFISKAQEECLNVDSFLKLVRQYTNIQELNAEIIRIFVDKIYVEKSEKVAGTRTKKQTIWIQWNYIGAVDIPLHK